MTENTEKKLYLNLKQKYDWTCWNCGNKKNYAKPSIFMLSFQMNMGGGTCPKCNEMMILRIDNSNDRMVSLQHMLGNIKCDGLPDSCYADLETARKTKKENKKLDG